jgi:murein endopeptidase
MIRLVLSSAVLWAFAALADGELIETPVVELPLTTLQPASEAAASAPAGALPLETPPPVEAELEQGYDGALEDSEAEAAADAAALLEAGVRYSADVSDEELARLWVENPAALGSLSVGLAEAGRVVNGVQVKPGDSWVVVDPQNAWGTQETVDFITAAAAEVRRLFPDAPPLRIGHIGRKDGGYLRPHRSHQSGRDVDVGFYYPRGEDPGRLSKRRDQAMDLAVNWAFLKAIITLTDVQFVFLDQRIQDRLYDFALKQGEDKTWLDRVFRAGHASIVKHARRHRDHFHVRFYAARSQELGRRILPLLAKQPEQNLVIHRVKRGDTLGSLARRFNSSVRLIQKANGMTTTVLSVGRTLNIPLRGPCTNCPMPPALVVPPRCLPPAPPDKS